MNDQEYQAGLPETPGYRYAKRVGQQLFVSGQVPNDAQGRIVADGDANQQATQCLLNLQTLLQVHGFDPSDIQQLVVYVVGDREQLSHAWEAVRQYFPQGVPPATLLGVNTLGYAQQIVEIDATIIKSDDTPAGQLVSS